MILRPTLDEARMLSSQGNLCPLYCEVPADLETPVSAYLKVARGKYSYLLESVEGGERLARYSFIGTEPYRTLRSGEGVGGDGSAADPLVAIEAELARFKPVAVPGLPRFTGGAVGYVGYEVVRYFEPRVPKAKNDELLMPESVFMFTDTLLVFDHLRHKIQVVSHFRLDGDIEAAYRQAAWRIEELVGRLEKPLAQLPYRAASGEPSSQPVASNMTQEQHAAAVNRAKEYIVAGDLIQVVLSQRFQRPTPAHPFDIYRALRTINPSPYMYYLDLGEAQLVGTSPEMLVRVEDGKIDYHPIAGTRPRGADAEADRALENDLVHDEKEIAEHVMLLDLGRNDVGRVSEAGTVEVPQVMDIERYSHVMHLVSHVTGKLRKGVTSYDALRACFPAGTVSGAPKIRAMEIIAEIEPDQRGPYAGCVGYFDLSGNIDTAITIRTILMKDGVANVQSGGGIVYDSDPATEYAETQNKARALIRAIEQAEADAASRPAGSLGY
ncbi:MAG TPA: anthranilate synthase component I [Dehalococcoidia bacterium]|nr:anthranilate synthase component I [Dehalococcoidia bacterium]